MASPILSYRDLIVWQRSMELVVAIYELTASFPSTERYGLTMQMRRCAVSIPSNIAEGKHRNTRKDFGHFLCIAFGSGAELETQIEIVKRLSWSTTPDYRRVDTLIDETMRMLNKMIANLKQRDLSAIS